MRRRAVRLAMLTGGLAALTVAIVALALQQAVLAALASEPEAVRGRVGSTMLVWGLAGVVLAAGLGAWLGSRLSTSFERLRRVLLERAAGDIARPLPETRLVEAGQLAQAVERVSSELTAHAARIERQRRELALLVESVSEGLLRIDERGRLAFLNPAAGRLLGLPASALGEPFAVLVRDVELRGIAERARGGAPVDGVELSLGERRVLVSAQPVKDDESAGAGAVVALADLTELRRLEGVRRDFVANVSHELKTPLTSIRGYVETVLNDDPPLELRRQFLEVARRNAERLQRIVDDLLDLSTIESGAWLPEVQELNAAELVREAWLACETRAREQRVAFRAPAGELRVLADAGAVRQVLGNLFDNALRYTPAAGNIEVRLRRMAASGGNGTTGWVLFEVSDSGSGIPHDALSRIFERFYRVDPARSRAAGGTGLGLAIVKHLVESMGGEVSADSELGKGTTIRFRLPAAS
ncbi:MAG TPA: ATP-binding protein [Longimicrobiales bacterium]|nr:ATP-binding protein [Longimicrobiales bacterium]